MLNIYFEVRKDVLLDYLPPEYNRTSPAYCRLSIFDIKDSPSGRFRDAYLGLGGRAGMMSAVFVAVSITDNAKVLAAGLRERGFPNTLGTIEFDADKSQARALIADQAGPLIEILMPGLQTIEPGRLAFDHADAILTRDGGLELVATPADMRIESAAICKNSEVKYPTERDSTWQMLNCRNIISAQLVRGVRTFAAGQGQAKSSA
jgi:hypothetical protein